MKNELSLVYYGHHKCASSWVNRLLWNISATLAVRFESFNSDEQAGGNISAAAEERRLDVLSIRNARWDHAEDFASSKGIHVVRDPRDIVVSGYFSHLKTHVAMSDELMAERIRLNEMTKEEGLIESMKGINGRTLGEMGDWRYGENPNILELRLEEMSGQPEKAFRHILMQGGWIGEEVKEGDDPLGLRLPGVDESVWKRSRGFSVLHRRLPRISEGTFSRLCKWVSYKRLSGGREPGQTDENSHYRSGVAGDWANHFTEETKGAFKKTFPGLVSRLGYEQDESW